MISGKILRQCHTRLLRVADGSRYHAKRPRRVGPPETMLPDPDDLPSAPAELAIRFSVAPAIAGNLLVPKFRARHRRPEVARAAVPEATVDKYRDPQPGEGEVGPAGDRIVAAPATDSQRSERVGKALLRGPVAPSANPGHERGALGR